MTMSTIYTIRGGGCRTFHAVTIDEAMQLAAGLMYAAPKARTQARADLAAGKPVTLTYGFATLTIEPGVTT